MNYLSTDVGVMAPETVFFGIFFLYNFENLLKNHFIEFNESWHNCALWYITKKILGIFDPCKSVATVTKNRT